jgi:hypothetical protein
MTLNSTVLDCATYFYETHCKLKDKKYASRYFEHAAVSIFVTQEKVSLTKVL